VLSQLKAFTRELDFMMMPNRGPACSLWQGSAPMQMLHYRPADGLFIFTQGCRHTIITVIFIVGGVSLVLITMSAVQRSGWLLQHRKCAFQVLKILSKTYFHGIQYRGTLQCCSNTRIIDAVGVPHVCMLLCCRSSSLYTCND
jgi:hypothetical protein